MEEREFNKMLSERTAKCMFLIFVLLLGSILRIAVIATGGLEQTRSEQSSYRFELCRLRGTVFDKNMVPLTNSLQKTAAAIVPVPQAVTAISTLLEGEQKLNVLETLKSGLPAVCDVPKTKSAQGISYIKYREHITPDMPASHIIGYTDDSGHGVSGLEAAYDDLLYSGDTLDAVFSINGKGAVLEGIAPYFEGDTSIIGDGVVTTLDINIQSIAEREAIGINKGAVVVAETATGRIRGMVSLPDYDATNLAPFLKRSDSPLLNRALAAFAVGSVFKPCIAAAALENGDTGHYFNCTGSMHIIDRRFNCHKRSGHGNIDLEHALAFSCNCYFYNLAISAGADRVYNTASSLTFGEEIRLCGGISTAKGNLTEKARLQNDAALANLSIGQGDLMLSPVSVLTLYLAIANGGEYILPTLVEGIIKDGGRENYPLPSPTRVMSEETANTLREYLMTVITEGTGDKAAPKSCTAAGKTSTAQTGRYENGIEQTNSWFCGFFPAEDPVYTVIVMSEGASKKSTAEVFADIADGICTLSSSGIDLRNVN